MFRNPPLWFLALLCTSVLWLGGCYDLSGLDDDDDSGSDDDDSASDDDDSTEPPPDDLDGDSILNVDEGQEEGVDTDGDGVLDAEDTDSDGDSIADADEAGDSDPETPPVDTDLDGVPDFRDDDSDGDGLTDAEEAGDGDPSTPPVDTDGDGSPDYIDTDSDGDGLSDDVEGADDFDGDGVPNHLDTDSDGDGVSDQVEGLGDEDGDGIPNLLDDDSDGDGIADSLEGAEDLDGDGVPNFLDLDSDGDGLMDAVEGTTDLDGDGLGNFIDVDSDGDMLSDGEEVSTTATNPYLADSDGDGSDDLIETALGTNPTDPEDNPGNNGDVVFVVSGRGELAPLVQTISSTTNYQQLDVFFLLDETCSMGPELSAMNSAVVSIIDSLTCESSGVPCVEDDDCTASEVCGLSGSCIEDPSLVGCVPSFWSGAGVYSDPSYDIESLANLSANPAATAGAIPTSTGGGYAENMFQAAACVANPTAAGCSGAISGCASSGIGCPGYRADAVRVLVEITDEPDMANNSFTAASAGAELVAQDIKFVGIDCDSGHSGLPDLEALALAANSVDSTGAPFVRSGDNAAVATQATAALQEILDIVPMEVTIEVSEVPGDSGDALPMLDYITVNTSGADLDGDGIPDCGGVTSTFDQDGDGWDESFSDLDPSNPVCWDVIPSDAALPVGTAAVQVFTLEVEIRGNDALVDIAQVHFIVAPLLPK
jgi:hypothetical protein